MNRQLNAHDGMLRTNLSTRPFYNERAVHALLGIAALFVLAVTIYNVTRIVRLSGENTAFSRTAQRDEVRASELERQSSAIQRGVNGSDLQDLAVAAREANTIIDKRTFSWTELFNRIETTLPPEVMITSVRPEIKKEGVSLTIAVLGRSVENIDEFMERLEATGAFLDLLSQQEEITDQGMYKALLHARYVPSKTD